MSLDRAEKILRLVADRGFDAIRVGALIRSDAQEQDLLDAAHVLKFTVQQRAGEAWVILP
jgi:acetolactate synthase regulatory subunit